MCDGERVAAIAWDAVGNGLANADEIVWGLMRGGPGEWMLGRWERLAG
ncbi:MAG: hypothetical protein U0075_19590 [Thermomicrobiales bacterium]